jgi:LuxR family quorum-sensing system transcriptional regulator CciR
MRRLTERFAEAAGRCTRLPELHALISDVSAELGFHHYALLDHASLGEAPASMVRIDNYPQSWVQELVDRRYGLVDPVHLASRRSNMGFAWSDLHALIKIDHHHKRILEQSRRHGLGMGFTIPSNVPGEPSASCSFVMRVGHELPLKRLECAELVGAHALRAARRLRGPRPRPVLSKREIECLRLIAVGKTDWEIARILDLSIDTVHQYVKRARAAYDTVSRTQLVVYALRDGWIGFEDAIPPNGGIG